MKYEQMMKLAAMVMAASVDAYADDRKRIVVSIPDRKLVLLRGDKVLKVYDVAVGKSSTPSPEGDFKIASRVPNPTWYGPGKIVGPGKENPLGTRWMGLG